MAKGVSDKFDEHERDTATRGYPQEILDVAKRTVKMSPFELDGLRHESGTRRAFSNGAVDHDDTQDHALAGAEGAAIEAAPHSRPTVERPLSEAGQVTLGSAPSARPVRSDSIAVARSSRDAARPAVVSPSRPASVGGWLVALLVVGVVLLVAAASAFGFVLGRRSVTR